MDYPVVTVAQLSAYLKALRKTHGLTQGGLGMLLGLKQVRIAEIEANPGSVSVAQMHRILSALGTQIVLHSTGAGWVHKGVQPDGVRTKSKATPSPSSPATPKGPLRKVASAGKTRVETSPKRAANAKLAAQPTKVTEGLAGSPSTAPKRRGTW